MTWKPSGAELATLYCEVNETFARYNRGFDTCDYDELLDTMTDDVTWISRPMGTIEGREAMAAFLEKFDSEEKYSKYRTGASQHRVQNLLLEPVTENQVKAWSHWSYSLDTPEGPHLAILGEYVDVLVKEADGRWRFKVRDILIKSDSGRA